MDLSSTCHLPLPTCRRNTPLKPSEQFLERLNVCKQIKRQIPKGGTPNSTFLTSRYKEVMNSDIHITTESTWDL